MKNLFAFSLLLLVSTTASAEGLDASKMGTITNRKTGATIEFRCENEECDRISYKKFSQTRAIEAEGERAVDWVTAELKPVPGVLDGTRAAFALGLLIDFSGDNTSIPICTILFTPVGFVFDVVALPVEAFNDLVLKPIRRAKFKKAVHGKDVKVSNGMFNRIAAALE